jgi:O-antigen/teichoic acid export membrane protein
MGKTMTRKVGEGTAWLAGSNFLIKIIGIFYTILVLSQLSVVEYGLLELAMSVPLLLGIFNLAGLQPVIVADLVTLHTEKKQSQMRDLFSSYVSLRIIMAILVSSGLLLATIFLQSFFSQTPIILVQLLCMVILFSPVRSFVNLCLSISHDFKRLATLSFSEELLKLGLVSVFLLYFNAGVMGVILAYVITDVSVALFFIPSMLRTRVSMFGGSFFSAQTLKPLTVLNGHVKWSLFQHGVHQFGQNVRPWLIQFFLGTQAVGLYALAFGMYQHVISLFPLSKVIAPIVPTFSSDPERLTRFANTAIKYDILIQTTLAIGCVVFVPFLIDVAFPSYASAYPLFLVLLVALIPSSFSKIYETIFQSLKLQKNLFTSNVVRLFSTIILLPLALFYFGIYGIAIEFFLTSATYAFGRYRVLRKVLPNYFFSFRTFITLNQTDVFILKKIKARIVKKIPL